MGEGIFFWDCGFFFKTLWTACYPHSLQAHVITSNVAVLVNPCLHYLLWVIFPHLTFSSRSAPTGAAMSKVEMDEVH
jgi:hypothetical protein